MLKCRNAYRALHDTDVVKFGVKKYEFVNQREQPLFLGYDIQRMPLRLTYGERTVLSFPAVAFEDLATPGGCAVVIAKLNTSPPAGRPGESA